MDLEEYKKIALARLNKSIAFDQKENMYYACMGLVEETGEIIAELRKPLFKGNFHEKPLDSEEIKKELVKSLKKQAFKTVFWLKKRKRLAYL